MIALISNSNVDTSDPSNYPDGRIKDNDGSGNGTGVNRNVYGDIHSTISKLMRLYNIVPSGLPDNESNGFQIIEAFTALASKNDYIYPLTTDGTFLNVGVKLSLMKTNEFLVCLAASDKTIETQIKGIGVGVFAVTYSGNFKANEYVRVVKTSVGVTIVRVADWNSLSAMVSDLSFLKKASQVEEDAGTSDTVATTPLVNKTTFIKRVIGADSGGYLATAIRNGLYPKEHFQTVTNLGNLIPVNIGYFESVNVGSSSGSLVCVGNVTAAVAASDPGNGETQITVTMANAMSTANNYYVRTFVRGQSADLHTDDAICNTVFKPISATQFLVRIKETANSSQLLRIYIEAINY